MTSAALLYDYERARAALERNPRERRRYELLGWQRGDLSWKLYPYQRPAYRAIHAAIRNPLTLKFCVNINRRWGKTYLLCLIASEIAQRKRRARIRMAAPTLDELRERIIPIMEDIHADCPERIRPVWKAQRKAWVWPNGARLYVAGVNNQGAKKLRGSGADLFLIDEGGYIDGVDKLINDVAVPQLLDTDGTLIGGSTPPDSAAHEFCDFYDECERDGNLYHADIYSMDLPAWKIEKYATEAGGYESVRFRREWLAHYVTDTELQVIPDWIPSLPGKPSPYVRTLPRDEYAPLWRRYTVMDIGSTRRDFTCVLFGRYHYDEARFYVERELVDKKLPRMKTPTLARRIREIERELWGEKVAAHRNFALDVFDHAPHRWADNNDPKLLLELATDPDNPVIFTPTSKDSLPRMVNRTRRWISEDRVAVAPECEYLQKNLAAGTWKNEDYINREFVRTNSLGHCDGLAALIYTVMNVNEKHNPIPVDLKYDRTRQRWRHVDEGHHERGGLADAFALPRFDS